jgi:hypothetical protein
VVLVEPASLHAERNEPLILSDSAPRLGLLDRHAFVA